MMKLIFTAAITVTIIFMSCGTPTDPESLIGDDGGYKIVGRYATHGYAQDVVVKDTIAYISQGQAGLITLSVLKSASTKICFGINLWLERILL